MIDPHASRREAAARIKERREQRMHRLLYLSQAVGPAAGRVISAVASVAPGPAGIALRAALNVLDGRKELQETRELRAELAALKKAVAELEKLAQNAEDSP